jgi:MFS transporter, PHS family, inorganic phosphate transporter
MNARARRGKLVGMVFATQALGLIVGPLIALTLLGAGASDNLAWRILLGLGVVPAAAVIYLRSRMPESPRYQVQVQGYFFTEFGPNMTIFVIPSEVYPVSMRATGHGISAGIGKLGAFIGVFLFPLLQTSLGLHGTLPLTAAVSVLGYALTLVLPQTSGVSLEDITTPSRFGLDETGIYPRFSGAPPLPPAD